jgi:catechol 2,3-dioxygenase-like lactoylglutathione lyase family enzyme
MKLVGQRAIIIDVLNVCVEKLKPRSGAVIVGVHHVQFTVSPGDEAAAREFYCHVLGLKEIPKPANLLARGGLWLELPNLQVHIGVESGVNRAVSKAHIAYEVKDLASWRLLLGQRGLPIEEGLPIPGYDRFEFRDPFGNRVELIERSDQPL